MPSRFLPIDKRSLVANDLFCIKLFVMSNTTISFTNSIPEQYEDLLGPFLFEPFAREMAARIRAVAAGDILELACGTGRLTRRLAGGLAEGVGVTAREMGGGLPGVARVGPAQ